MVVLRHKVDISETIPHRNGLMVRVSASHAVSRGFVPETGHTKHYHKNGTNCLPAWHAVVRVGVWQCTPIV